VLQGSAICLVLCFNERISSIECYNQSKKNAHHLLFFNIHSSDIAKLRDIVCCQVDISLIGQHISQLKTLILQSPKSHSSYVAASSSYAMQTHCSDYKKRKGSYNMYLTTHYTKVYAPISLHNDECTTSDPAFQTQRVGEGS